MKPRDIFGLAVRLLGLLFLYLGLRAVVPLLDVELIENSDKTDLIDGLMPVVFNLAIAWWLLGGGLVRRAYPEPRSAKSARPQENPEMAPSVREQRDIAAAGQPGRFGPSEVSGMEQAEHKLAALVDRPGRGGAA
ncbi:MAG: hypothetical protein ACRED1_06475 [Limisphaerales bacterium]